MKLFVYGALRPGEWAAARVGPQPNAVAGIAWGRLGKYGELYGAEFEGAYAGTPGVPGFVIDVDDEMLARLDRFEGDGYDRVDVAVRTLTGWVQAAAYEWNGSWGELRSLEEWSADLENMG